MEFCIIEKDNNSLATKLCANLLNTCFKKQFFLGEQHNLMNRVCRALFKCKNKLKLVEKTYVQRCSALKRERM